MGNNKQLEEAREKVIESISKNMSLYGVTPSVGRLYGTIYFHEGPMTLDEMKEELGMSKTSMSTAVRQLMDLKMVEKVWQKGVRKDLYEVVEDWHQTFFDFFSLKWRMVVDKNVSAIQRSSYELNKLIENNNTDKAIKESAFKDIKKLKNALLYYEWLDQFIDTLEKKSIYDFVPPKNHK